MPPRLPSLLVAALVAVPVTVGQLWLLPLLVVAGGAGEACVSRAAATAADIGVAPRELERWLRVGGGGPVGGKARPPAPCGSGGGLGVAEADPPSEATDSGDERAAAVAAVERADAVLPVNLLVLCDACRSGNSAPTAGVAESPSK